MTWNCVRFATKLLSLAAVSTHFHCNLCQSKLLTDHGSTLSFSLLLLTSFTFQRLVWFTQANHKYLASTLYTYTVHSISKRAIISLVAVSCNKNSFYSMMKLLQRVLFSFSRPLCPFDAFYGTERFNNSRGYTQHT